jgi:hypothetical protein
LPVHTEESPSAKEKDQEWPVHTEESQPVTEKELPVHTEESQKKETQNRRKPQNAVIVIVYVIVLIVSQMAEQRNLL